MNAHVGASPSYSSPPFTYDQPTALASTSSINTSSSKSSNLNILNIFKSSKPPPVPEKDPQYKRPLQQGPSSVSLSLSEHESNSPLQPNVVPTLRPKKSWLGLPRKSSTKSKKSTESLKSVSRSSNDTDQDISTPWNIVHSVHVDETLTGLPPQWHASLPKLGYSPTEIEALIERRRQQTGPAVTIPAGPNAASQLHSLTSTPTSNNSSPRNHAPYRPQPAHRPPALSLRTNNAQESYPRGDSLPSSPVLTQNRPDNSPRPPLPKRPSTSGSMSSHPPHQHTTQPSSTSVSFQRKASFKSPTRPIPPPPPFREPLNQPQELIPTSLTTPPPLISPPAIPVHALLENDSLDDDDDDGDSSNVNNSPKLTRRPTLKPMHFPRGRAFAEPPRLSFCESPVTHDDWSSQLLSALPSAKEFGPLQENHDKANSSPLHSAGIVIEVSNGDGDDPTVRKRLLTPGDANNSDRGSTGSLGMDEEAVVSHATAITLARAPSVSINRALMGKGAGYQAAGKQSGERPDPLQPRQGQQYSRSSSSSEEMVKTPQSEAYIDDQSGDGVDEEDDPDMRYTIRLDDVQADRMLASIVNGDVNGKYREERPSSVATIQAEKVNSQSADALLTDDRAEADEEAASALDEWLEADEQEESLENDDNRSLNTRARDTYEGNARHIPSIGGAKQPSAPSVNTRAHPNSEMRRILNESAYGDHIPTEDTQMGADAISDSSDIITHSLDVCSSKTISKQSPDTSRHHSPQTQEGTETVQSKGDLSHVIEPIIPYLLPNDPRKLFSDLQEFAEGESGNIYSAKTTDSGTQLQVAIKKIRLASTASVAKILGLKSELAMLNNVRHRNVLLYTGLWLANDATECTNSSFDNFTTVNANTELWIRMELMERSLADMLSLVSEGLIMEEHHVAKLAKDVGEALAYLEGLNIAHRDVRSDNLLLSKSGVVKLVDFSNAVKVTPDDRIRSDNVGVIYWQAPEIRRGPYDVLKVDVWSLGITVWELIEGVTPFENHSEGPGDSFPDFLQAVSDELLAFVGMCEQPAQYRPSATKILKSAWIQAACSQADIMKLLSAARQLESSMREE